MPAASRGLFLHTDDLSERYILLSAARWFIDTSFQLAFMNGTILSMMWAFCAADNVTHVFYTMGIESLMQRFDEILEEELDRTLSLGQSEYAFASRIKKLMKQKTSLDDWKSFEQKLVRLEKNSPEFFHARPPTWNQGISRELLMNAHHVQFSSWALRYDRFFFTYGTVLNLRDFNSRSEPRARLTLTDLGTVGWLHAKRLAF